MEFTAYYLINFFSNRLLNVLSEMVLFLFLFVWFSHINPAIKNKMSVNVTYPLSMIILLYYGPLESIVLSFTGTFLGRLFFRQPIIRREGRRQLASLLISTCVYIACGPLYAWKLEIFPLLLILSAYQLTYFILEVQGEARNTGLSMAEYTGKIQVSEWFMYAYVFFSTAVLVLLFAHHPFITTFAIIGKSICSQHFMKNFYILQEKSRLRDLRIQEAMNKDLEFARQVQFQLLKPTPRIIEGWRIDADYCPAKQVSGDYYDIAYTNNKKIRLLIADVMGKGLAASLLMTTLSAITRERMTRSLSPKDLLSFINTQLYENLKASTAFITILCVDVDPVSGAITYCSAGHHPPLIRSADGTVRTLTLGKNASVGMLPNPQFNEGTDQINKEDYLLLYTDGAIEIRNQKPSWGRSALQQYLSDWPASRPVYQLSKQLISDLTDKNEHGLHDDITLLSMSFAETGMRHHEKSQKKGGTVHAAL